MAEKSIKIPIFPVPTTKITDINIDCLEKIFNYLTFEDLLNVADSNKYLKSAADLVYTLKYGSGEVCIQIHQKYFSNVYFNKCNRIIIYSIKTVLQTLRCFGHMITRINFAMMFEMDYRSWIGHLMEYIGEYCAESLFKLKFMVPINGAFGHLKKSLPNVQKIVTYENGITINLLNKLFPNVKSIKFVYHRQLIQDGKCIAVDFENVEKNFFPNFDQMSIKLGAPNRYSLHTEEVHKDIFDLVKLTAVKPFEKHLFQHLEEFCLEINFYNDDNFYKFFSKYPSISKFLFNPDPHCSHKFIESDLNVTKLAHNVPWLKEIDLKFCKFTPKRVVYWIKQFKSLDVFQFHFGQHAEFIDLQTRLGSEWKGTVTIDGDLHRCAFIRNFEQNSDS